MTFRLKEWSKPQRCQAPECDAYGVGVLRFDDVPSPRGRVTVYSIRCEEHSKDEWPITQTMTQTR